MIGYTKATSETVNISTSQEYVDIVGVPYTGATLNLGAAGKLGVLEICSWRTLSKSNMIC